MPDFTSQLPLVIFDIDGVVADVRHRLSYVAHAPKNWPAFFAAAHKDPPLLEGITLAQQYALDHQLVWLTGRPESLRTVTQDWLQRYNAPMGKLIMRPLHDRRPARIWKVEQVRHIKQWGKLVAIVDDDPAVVDQLRAHGWPVTLADWVSRPQALSEAQENEGRT